MSVVKIITVNLCVFGILLTFCSCRQNAGTPSREVVSLESDLLVSCENSKQEQSLPTYSVENNDFAFKDDIQVEGNPHTKTSNLLAQKNIVVNGKDKSLVPIQTDSGDLTGYSYDHYKDELGNIYKFYSGTNIFAEYQKKVDHIALGNCEVNGKDAIAECEKFLNKMGYSVGNFNLEHSNDYCYDFKATYTFCYNDFQTNEKLIFHLMADDNGCVYITDFKATDYGRFSQDDQILEKRLDLDLLKKELEIQLNEYSGKKVSTSTVLWKNEDDVIGLRTTVFTENNTEIIYTYVK